MTLAQKMLQNNGITPKLDTDNQDLPGNQTDIVPGASGDNTADDPPPADKVEPVTPAPADTPEPDEQSILKVLASRGINIKSLSELAAPAAAAAPPLTEAEKEAAEIKRQNEIRAFGLESGAVTTTYIDNFIRESSLDPVVLGYKVFEKNRIAEAKEAGEDAPDKEDLRKEFDDLNFQYAGESDPRRKAAEKRLQSENEHYLQTEYEKVYTLEDNFNDHQATKAKRKAYNATVDLAVATLGDTLSFTVTDDTHPTQKQEVVLKVKLKPEDLKAIATHYAGDEMFNVIGKDGVQQKDLAQAMKNSLTSKNFDRIISEVALAYADQRIKGIKMGRREIFTTTNTGKDAAGKKVSPGVRKILDKNKTGS